jgi:2-keto-3-deoxy-L-rhamnonate aldolase RhmA
MVQELGLDFVFIDTEHIAFCRDTLSWMCQGYRAVGMALDGGASGVIAPYVETVEQVQALRGAVKLRPRKGQRLEEALRSNEELEPELAAYLSGRNGCSVLMVMIESRPAVEALDDLLSVPGLDGVLIGPHDLSTSLGVPEQYRHPEFNQCVRNIIRRARAARVGAGIHFWEGLDLEIQWADAGANIILHSSDLTAYHRTTGIGWEGQYSVWIRVSQDGGRVDRVLGRRTEGRWHANYGCSDQAGFRLLCPVG